MSKVYVVEVKNSLADWHPQETYLSRWPADASVDKKRAFMKLNKIKGVRVRVKTYVPLRAASLTNG